MKIEIPYNFRLVLPILLWGFICLFFVSVVFLNVATIDESGKNFFIIFSFLYAFCCTLFVLLRNIKGSPFLLSEAKTLSENIKEKKLAPGLNSNNVAETFSSFSIYSRKCLHFSVAASIFFVIFLIFWQFIFFDNFLNIYIIFISGIFIISLLSSFSIFLSQLQFFPIAKQCRDFLADKGLCPIESKFQSIKVKFAYLFIFFIDTLFLYLLSIVSTGNIGATIFFTGLGMIIFVSLILLFYLEKAFEELFDLTQIAFNEDLTIFSTGSLDKEFVDLAKNLNEISIQLYFFKEKTESSKKEMVKRVDELEKFFDLAVKREEKMIELKKENKIFRDRVEELSNK